MGKQWTHTVLPRELLADLREEADDMLRAYQAGKCDLPAEFCEHVPVHFVIRRALDEMRAKKARSKAPRRAVNRGNSLDGLSDVYALHGGLVNRVRAREGAGE